MFSKRFTIISLSLAALFLLGYLGAVICQAHNSHPCCAQEKADCPLIVFKNIPKTAEAKLIILPDACAARLNPAGTLKSERWYSPALQIAAVPEPSQPVKISLLIHAPPQA